MSRFKVFSQKVKVDPDDFGIRIFSGEDFSINDLVNLDGAYLSLDDRHDTIYTGNAADAILSRGGNDTIHSNGGNDFILSKNGNDTIYSGSGNDYIRTGNGDDYANGGNGNDFIYGYNGNDRLDGSFGDDIVNGGRGNDDIVGGTGTDILRGGPENDVFLIMHDAIIGAHSAADKDYIVDFAQGQDKLEAGVRTRITAEDYDSRGDGHADSTIVTQHGKHSVVLLGFTGDLTTDDFTFGSQINFTDLDQVDII